MLLNQPENRNSLSRVIAGKQISTVDLVVKLQFAHSPEIRAIRIRRVIEKQQDLPWILIVRFHDFRHHFMQNLDGKRIEEIAPIDFQGHGIRFRIRRNKFCPCSRNGCLLIVQRALKNPLVIFDADGFCFHLIRDEKIDASLPEAVIQNHILFADEAFVRQPFQNTVRRGLVSLIF